jgi:two-component system, OmpR family, sensor histidine kinase TctE
MGIRQRLIALLLLPMALLLSVSVISDFRIAVAPAIDAYDQALADAALAIAAHAQVKDGIPYVDLTPQAIAFLRTDQMDEIFYSVTGPKGEFLGGDRAIPAPIEVHENTVFMDARYDGKPVRIVSYRTQTTAGPVRIQVAETTHKRTQVERRILVAMIVPNLLLISATLLLVYFGIQRGLAPLAKLREEIQSRTPKQLDALDERPVPGEVRPLVSALNRLFTLLKESSGAQQRFLANTAHQLRTPLAGLQAQLDVMAKEAASEPIASRLDELRGATRRLAHLTNQLLALARAEPASTIASRFTTLDLRAVLEESASIYLDRALAKDIDLGFETAAVQITGSAWLVRELLANVIENAIHYTAPGGHITVRCGHTLNCAYLEIEDDGRGIPESERNLVLERFYRIPGTGGDGCGLGLAIVREIAESHDARVEIADPPQGRGTLVRVSFPLQES